MTRETRTPIPEHVARAFIAHQLATAQQAKAAEAFGASLAVWRESFKGSKQDFSLIVGTLVAGYKSHLEVVLVDETGAL